MASARLPTELVVAWARHALAKMAAAREEIDRLNVFPVPDGDTGTNMYLTLESAVLAMEAQESQRPDGVLGETWADADPAVQRFLATLQALARGALLGARGNSGVILSQIFRGVLHTDVVIGSARPSQVFAKGLQSAAQMAYSAVSNPLEGTILTVIRVAAEDAVAAAERGASFTESVLVAADGAQRALDTTPDLLPALAAAGVVDSGGRGMVVILDALAEVVTGEARPTRPATPAPMSVATAHTHGGAEYDGPAYEVMFLLDAAAEAIPALKQTLSGLGDSLVVVGGDGLWNVHVHVDDAGAAVEAGMAAGRPHRIRIQWLREPEPTHGGVRKGRALLAVSHGPGVAELLAAANVVAIPARPRISPSTGELLAAIEASGAAEVILLPGGKDIRPPAEAAAARARQDGVRVAVVPTRAIVQSLAAIAVHEPERGFDDDVAAMSRAAGATGYGAVTISSRSAMTSAGLCEPGDVLGLVNGDIVQIGTDEIEVALAVVAEMARKDSEIITVLAGADLDPADLAALVAQLEDRYPNAEVVAESGGQPLWPIIVGVE